MKNELCVRPVLATLWSQTNLLKDYITSLSQVGMAAAWLFLLWVWFEPKEPQDTTSKALAFSAVTQQNFRSH